VNGLCSATPGGSTGNRGNTGKEAETLQRMLDKIDFVSNLRAPCSEGPSHSGLAEGRPSGVSHGATYFIDF
jgi:hypothetical protein